MDERKHDGALDVEWKPSIDKETCINFRKNKKYNKISILLKAVTFVVIACISGGVSAAYIVDQKYPSNGYTANNPGNKSIFEQSAGNIKTTDIPENTITEIVSTVGPAIVGISNRGPDSLGGVSVSTGSGIIFSKDGLIVTNFHIVEGADKLTVKLSSGKSLNAVIVGYDDKIDIAILKVNSSELPVAKFGDASKIRVGQTAVAIGNPFGEEFAGTVTTGVISTLNRKVKVKYDNGQEDSYKVFLTDATINSGNSGGALCNEAGEVIGLNSYKFSMDSNAEGMNVAVSINDVNRIINNIINQGKEKEPSLGLSVVDAIPDSNNSVKGAYVNGVDLNSNAYKAKIRNTDIITAIDNVKVNNKEDLEKAVKEHKIGDNVVLKIWRNGKTIDVSIALTSSK